MYICVYIYVYMYIHTLLKTFSHAFSRSERSERRENASVLLATKDLLIRVFAERAKRATRKRVRRDKTTFLNVFEDFLNFSKTF